MANPTTCYSCEVAIDGEPLKIRQYPPECGGHLTSPLVPVCDDICAEDHWTNEREEIRVALCEDADDRARGLYDD